MPFEPLFGRRPQGLLDVAKEAWEEQPSPFHTIIKQVSEMQEHMDRVAPIMPQHLLSAQAKQSCLYNQAGSPSPGFPSW